MTDTTRDLQTYSVDAFNPLDPQTLQCPYPWFQVLRREAPVHFVAPIDTWCVFTHELVTEVATNHEEFSSEWLVTDMQLPVSEGIAAEVAAIEAQGWPMVNMLLTSDPPEHHYHRRMVARAFTPRLVAQLESAIREIAAELANDIPAGEPVEFIKAFAAPFPLRVIAKVLNVSDDRVDDFKRWTDKMMTAFAVALDDEGYLDQARNKVEFQRYFAAEFDDRRAHPRDDLLTGLITASSAADDDEPLSTAELLSFVQQLLVAGNETSTKTLTGSLHQLAIAPKWWDWLRENPTERSGSFVEEALRFLTPVQIMFRVTKEETTLGGYTIPAGARVAMGLASANRDEAQFDKPEEFNPERTNARTHVAFSTGIHACLGASLARLQLRIALEELVRRFDSVKLPEDTELEYEANFLVRGLTRLPLIFESSVN